MTSRCTVATLAPLHLATWMKPCPHVARTTTTARQHPTTRRRPPPSGTPLAPTPLPPHLQRLKKRFSLINSPFSHLTPPQRRYRPLARGRTRSLTTPSPSIVSSMHPLSAAPPFPQTTGVWKALGRWRGAWRPLRPPARWPVTVAVQFAGTVHRANTMGCAPVRAAKDFSRYKASFYHITFPF